MTTHRSLLSILKDRLLWTGPLPFTLAILAAANLGIASWKSDLEARRRANLLLNPPPASAEGGPAPRYDQSVGERLGAFWPFIPDARRAPLVVLVGMSQMYSINQSKPDDQTIAERMDDALRRDNIRVFGLAAPNLDNEEALLYLLATLSSPETRPTAFIYGLCFDKFRNVDVRTTLLDFMRARPAAAAEWHAACEGLHDSYPMACEKIKATEDIRPEVPAAKQEGAEHASLDDRVRGGAARALPMVDARRDLNAFAQMQAYTLRNRVFGIKATTKRPILQGRYELNKQLLELLVEIARRRGVALFFYVIPLNPRADTPYVPEEYEGFKRWAEALAQRRSVPFTNLEPIVPGEDWGVNEAGEIDFKHFRGSGHRITAEALLERFGPAIREAARTRAAP